jgi:hypothetical protein
MGLVEAAITAPLIATLTEPGGVTQSRSVFMRKNHLSRRAFAVVRLPRLFLGPAAGHTASWPPRPVACGPATSLRSLRTFGKHDAVPPGEWTDPMKPAAQVTKTQTKEMLADG